MRRTLLEKFFRMHAFANYTVEALVLGEARGVLLRADRKDWDTLLQS
jgi:hypothetical protein